jgi:hypothetical protein
MVERIELPYGGRLSYGNSWKNRWVGRGNLNHGRAGEISIFHGLNAVSPAFSPFSVFKPVFHEFQVFAWFAYAGGFMIKLMHVEGLIRLHMGVDRER